MTKLILKWFPGTVWHGGWDTLNRTVWLQPHRQTMWLNLELPWLCGFSDNWSAMKREAVRQPNLSYLFLIYCFSKVQSAPKWRAIFSNKWFLLCFALLCVCGGFACLFILLCFILFSFVLDRKTHLEILNSDCAGYFWKRTQNIFIFFGSGIWGPFSCGNIKSRLSLWTRD